MERGSDKHGPHLDDAMKHEVEGAMRAERSTHVEDWKEPEPSGEDQPDVEAEPHGPLMGGTPAGMTAEDVQFRSELARYLGKDIYPADRDRLIEVMRSHQAPDRLIAMVERLPAGNEYSSLQEVTAALGHGVEGKRF
ncbi:hypothetical protein TH66_23020 [Carbonactinospora thermoautotrophica]|nr:DUF2795 domain-containing protein [Carbonactinospora thermoautotrophica]KWW98128.1 hypothetical protein TH66_23020 [Carbonactinospora thermoautotrophica]KWX10114.1 hypothetical protein TR74_05560 [Carbonactinospora thermoautotrophica]